MPDETARLYPDLVAAGGLNQALQAALTSIGSELRVAGLDPAINCVVYARIELNSRFSQISIAAQERLFLFDFWKDGVVLAHGQTPDMTDTARAIARWVGSRCAASELAAEFPFVTLEPHAAAYECGEYVEERWRDYLAHIGTDFPELTVFVVAASRRRELRQLFPYTSLNRFCFSRCTGYPFTGDTPHVRPQPDGQYAVVGPDQKVLGQGDAEYAVELVVRHLPANCGPAVLGTAETMGR